MVVSSYPGPRSKHLPLLAFSAGVPAEHPFASASCAVNDVRKKRAKNMETTTTNQIRQLSQEEENLKSFREERKKDRTYIKFEDKETRILKFDTTKRAKREPSEVYIVEDSKDGNMLIG